ncbi:MAG: AAA family ATPase [Anaerolineae bacterium]|nr:AAA family ATPase [Anaerolineae bacterium]
MTALPKLPIGISSFEVLRQGGYVYVDKTKTIYRLVSEGMYYFLSRPRRFGKSLLVSTLRCLFEGKKSLFEGLWLAENVEWVWDVYPVVLLDFNEISHDTPQNLEHGLGASLANIAQAYGVGLEADLLKERFKELLLKLWQTTGKPVVVLVDEYDKPIIEHLGQGEERSRIAEANRDILRYFFGVLKGGGGWMRCGWCSSPVFRALAAFRSFQS